MAIENTVFRDFFYPRLSIVQCFFDCRLSSVQCGSPLEAMITVHTKSSKNKGCSKVQCLIKRDFFRDNKGNM